MSTLPPSSTTCPRTIFFTNLVILGFDPSIHATGTYASITFDKDMFSRGNNNVKAMELVVWFLFDILDQELAKERFIGCWPTTTNTNSREFRSIAFKWIEQMKKDNLLSPPDIIIRKSFFDECRGERFERIMLALSTHVVKKVLERNVGKNKVPINDFETLRTRDQVELKRQLQTFIHMQSEAFIARTSQRHQIQVAWKERALEIERRLHEIAIKNNEITEARTKLHEAHPSLSDYITETLDNLSMEELEELRDENIESVTGLWEEVLRFIDGSEKKRKILEDVINDRANKFRLDGKAVKLEVPEEFIKIWNTEFQKGQITPYRSPNNNLDLISLLTIWKLYLRTLQSKSSSLSSSNIKNEHISGLEVLLARFQQQKIAVASLKIQLQEKKNKINSMVGKLKESGKMAINKDTFYRGKERLELLKPLPPFSLTCDVPEIAMKQLSKSLLGTAQGMSDAISEIDNKVWNTVRKKEAIETEASIVKRSSSPLKSPLRTAADKENRPIKKVIFSASTLDRDNANQKIMASARVTSLVAKFDEIAKKRGLNSLNMEPTSLPQPSLIPKPSNSSTTRPKVASDASRISHTPGRTIEVAITEKTPKSKKKETASRIADSTRGGPRRRANENEKMDLRSASQDTAKAYNILADQIVAHVVGEDDPSSITPISRRPKRSSTITPGSRQSRYSDMEGEDILNDLIRRRASRLIANNIGTNNDFVKVVDGQVIPHGITDPIEALEINAFHARREIPRTPLVHPVRSVSQTEGLTTRTPESRVNTSKYSGQSSGTEVSWNTPNPTRTVSDSAAKPSPTLRSALKNRSDRDGLSGSPSSLTVGSPPRGPVRFAGSVKEVDTEAKSVEQKMLQEINRQWGDSSPAFVELRRQMPSASPISASPSSRGFRGDFPAIGHGSPSLFRKDIDLSKQLIPVSPLSPGFHNFINMERERGPPPEKALSPPRKGIREELWRAREEMNSKKTENWRPDVNLEDDTWTTQDHESLLDFDNILDEGGNIELEVFDEDVPSEIFETREVDTARW